jgi:hypothetical protein
VLIPIVALIASSCQQAPAATVGEPQYALIVGQPVHYAMRGPYSDVVSPTQKPDEDQIILGNVFSTDMDVLTELTEIGLPRRLKNITIVATDIGYLKYRIAAVVKADGRSYSIESWNQLFSIDGGDLICLEPGQIEKYHFDALFNPPYSFGGQKCRLLTRK